MLAPSRALGLLEVDLRALRAAPLVSEITRDVAAGVGAIERRCRFDPFEGVRTVQVFVIGAPNDGAVSELSLDDLLFVARGSLDPEALAQCVGDVVRAEGGGVHRTTIEGRPAIAGDRGRSVAAFFGGDGVVAGPDVAVAELLQRIDGVGAPPRELAAMRSIWRATADRRHLRFIARLPRNYQRLLGRLGAFVDGLEISRAQGLALGASIDEGLAVTLALSLGDASAALVAKEAVEARIAAALGQPELAASVLGVTLRRLRCEARQRDLVLRVEVDRPELEALVAALRRVLEARGDALSASPTTEP